MLSLNQGSQKKRFSRKNVFYPNCVVLRIVNTDLVAKFLQPALNELHVPTSNPNQINIFF